MDNIFTVRKHATCRTHIPRSQNFVRALHRIQNWYWWNMMRIRMTGRFQLFKNSTQADSKSAAYNFPFPNVVDLYRSRAVVR